jgi:hypothetical protein
MNEKVLLQVRQIIEDKADKGLARFNKFCQRCQQHCESDHCSINNTMIRKSWDWEDGKEGRNIDKMKSEGCTHINELRPLLSLFDPSTDPLSMREKIFDFFQIENGELGIMVLMEMTKKSKKFEIFLIKICLYARDHSMYEYADDKDMYNDIFGIGMGS